MKISTVYNKLSSSFVATRIMAAFAAGLLFPFMAWVLDAGIHNEMLTFKTIGASHLRNPIHFLVDLFPFLFSNQPAVPVSGRIFSFLCSQQCRVYYERPERPE